MIKLGKDLYFKNLLSFRKTLTQNEIQKEKDDDKEEYENSFFRN